MQLVVSNNDSFNPLSLDLSNFIQVDDTSMDPADPSFTDKVISHSLLKTGGVLALTDLKNKELVFPLALYVPDTASVVNEVLDPSFEYDTVGAAPLGWQAYTTGLAASPILQVGDSWAASGENSCSVTATVSGGVAGAEMNSTIAVVAGQSYPVLATVNIATLATGGHVTVDVNWQNSSGGFISSSNVDVISTTGVTVASGTVTAPANATEAVIQVNAAGANGNYAFAFDSVAFDTSTYFDGDSTLAYWTGIPGLSASEMMTGPSGVAALVERLNRILGDAGATVSWQDDGMSQPTIFDLIGGQFDIEYDYRQEQKAWLKGKLRLFAQPLGRKASPRFLAAASGCGPLLLISPYSSQSALAVVPTQVGGISGLGGAPAGASSGVFYANPTLDGDAPAQLVLSYQGPIPPGATNTGVVPYMAVSVLPDKAYQPFIGPSQMTLLSVAGGPSQTVTVTNGATPNYVKLRGDGYAYTGVQFSPIPSADSGLEPTVRWAGQHRLFAIARSLNSVGPAPEAAIWLEGGFLTGAQGQPQTIPGEASSSGGPDWGIYDLGTFTLTPSQLPSTPVQVNMSVTANGIHGCEIDLAGLIMLPDNSTWFLNPSLIPASQYGYPPGVSQLGWSAPISDWSQTLIVDDTVGQQGLWGPSQTGAPSPVGQMNSSGVITPYSRGVMPTLDPADGVPIIAILGIGQNASQSFSYQPAGASPGTVVSYTAANPATNPLIEQVSAQVWVQERTRYVFS